MTIRITRHPDGLYSAVVEQPTQWSTPDRLRASELVERLRALGCHTTDIGDAFYEADPEWLADLDSTGKAL